MSIIYLWMHIFYFIIFDAIDLVIYILHNDTTNNIQTVHVEVSTVTQSFIRRNFFFKTFCTTWKVISISFYLFYLFLTMSIIPSFHITECPVGESLCTLYNGTTGCSKCCDSVPECKDLSDEEPCNKCKLHRF